MQAPADRSRYTDVISGGAGILLALIADDSDSAARAAHVLADRLVEAAEPGPDGLHWRMAAGWEYLMPGFSHGTAGVAYALAAAGLHTEPRRPGGRRHPRRLRPSRHWAPSRRLGGAARDTTTTGRPGGELRLVPRSHRHRASVPPPQRHRPATTMAARHRCLPAGLARQPPAYPALPRILGQPRAILRHRRSRAAPARPLPSHPRHRPARLGRHHGRRRRRPCPVHPVRRHLVEHRIHQDPAGTAPRARVHARRCRNGICQVK